MDVTSPAPPAEDASTLAEIQRLKALPAFPGNCERSNQAAARPKTWTMVATRMIQWLPSSRHGMTALKLPCCWAWERLVSCTMLVYSNDCTVCALPPGRALEGNFHSGAVADQEVDAEVEDEKQISTARGPHQRRLLPACSWSLNLALQGQRPSVSK